MRVEEREVKLFISDVAEASELEMIRVVCHPQLLAASFKMCLG